MFSLTEKIKQTLLVCWLKSQTQHLSCPTISPLSQWLLIWVTQTATTPATTVSNLEPNPKGGSSWQIFWCAFKRLTTLQKSSHKPWLAGRSPGQQVTSLSHWRGFTSEIRAAAGLLGHPTTVNNTHGHTAMGTIWLSACCFTIFPIIKI